ncbi:hypothetical protein Tco_0950095 [Tanacetum coccineum]
MEEDNAEDMEVEVLSSMWPEDIDAAGKKFNVEKPGGDQDLLEDVTFIEEPTIVDFKQNVVRPLREELKNLSKEQHESELKKLEILEEHQFEDEIYGCDKRPVSILDGVCDIFQDVPKNQSSSDSNNGEIIWDGMEITDQGKDVKLNLHKKLALLGEKKRKDGKTARGNSRAKGQRD